MATYADTSRWAVMVWRRAVAGQLPPMVSSEWFSTSVETDRGLARVSDDIPIGWPIPRLLRANNVWTVGVVHPGQVRAEAMSGLQAMDSARNA
jgi:hypothetical protein